MAKIPTVTPSRESSVRSKFDLRAPRENRMLSSQRRRIFVKPEFLDKVMAVLVSAISQKDYRTFFKVEWQGWK
jgi:hypothetical protein